MSGTTPANPAIATAEPPVRSLPDPMRPTAQRVSAAARTKSMLSSRMGSAVAIVLAIMWTVPTLGLLVSSARPEGQIRTTGWWNFFSDPSFTLENYRTVLFGRASTGQLANFFMNSLTITVPATVIPLIVATMGAYAFSVLRWRGRDTVFVIVFALQIVPLQMALIPLLRIFSGSAAAEAFPFLPIWVAHSAFGLPLAIFLLHNFMADVPRELVEAARVDGAGHVTLFFRIMLPLMVPAIASFAIFQFLWVWNDLLVAYVFLGGTGELRVLTVALRDLVGARGENWHLLTAAAFISMSLPLLVFFSLQRYFVRGLTAGSVKG